MMPYYECIFARENVSTIIGYTKDRVLLIKLRIIFRIVSRPKSTTVAFNQTSDTMENSVVLQSYSLRFIIHTHTRIFFNNKVFIPLFEEINV